MKTISKQKRLWIPFLLSLTACTDTRMNVEDRRQINHIHQAGFETDSAKVIRDLKADLVMKNEKGFKDRLSSVFGQTGTSFDWVGFWTSWRSEEFKTVGNFEPSTLELVWKISRAHCSGEVFSAFIESSLANNIFAKIPTDLIASCPLRPSDQIVRLMAQEYFAKESVNALSFLEASNKEISGDLKARVLKSLDASLVEGKMNHLLKNSLLGEINSLYAAFDSPQTRLLLNRIILSKLMPIVSEEFLEKQSIVELNRFLSVHLEGVLTGAFQQNRLRPVLLALTKRLSNEISEKCDVVCDVPELLQFYVHLREWERRSSVSLLEKFDSRARWLNQVNSSLLQAMHTQPGVSEWIRNSPLQPVDQGWFLSRMRGAPLEANQVLSPQTDFLAELTRLQVSIRETSANVSSYKDLQTYCTWMQSKGLNGSFDSGEKLLNALEKGTAPVGCLSLEERKASFVFQANLMSSFLQTNVLILPGASVRLEGALSNLFAIDVSEVQAPQFEELQFLPPENGIVVPLLMIVEITEDFGRNPPGRLAFQMHTVLKEPSSLEWGARLPEQGYTGGQIDFHATEAYQHRLPLAFAFGGPGEIQSKPRLPGGYNFLNSALKRWKKWIHNASQFSGDSDLPLSFVDGFTGDDLKLLLSVARRNEKGQILLMTPKIEDYFANMPDIAAKLTEFCGFKMEAEDCLKDRVVTKAADQILEFFKYSSLRNLGDRKVPFIGVDSYFPLEEHTIKSKIRTGSPGPNGSITYGR